MVIGAASFGQRMPWNGDSNAPPGHSLTFKDALYEVSHRLLLRILFPPWVLRFGTAKMRRFARAYDELGVSVQCGPFRLERISGFLKCCVFIYVAEVFEGDGAGAPCHGEEKGEL